MSNNCPRAWAVLRVVDGELCFAEADGTFAPLNDDTLFYIKRNDAYEAAQICRGLICIVGPKLAQAYALTASFWPHNQPVIGGTPVIVRDAVAG